jgi:hypothetical protein
MRQGIESCFNFVFASFGLWFPDIPLGCDFLTFSCDIVLESGTKGSGEEHVLWE